MLEIWREMLSAAERGSNAVLVIVVESLGSTPRKAGAMMLCVPKNGNDGGEIKSAGTIGGGISEHLAIEEAKILLREKSENPRIPVKEYHLYPNDNADIGGQCGGSVKVLFMFLEYRRSKEFAKTVIAAFNKNSAWLFVEYDEVGNFAYRILTDGIHLKLQCKGGKMFPLFSAGFVHIAGGGHISVELCPLLTKLGFRVIIIEERAEFAAPERFAAAQKVLNQGYDSLKNLLGEDDYAVIITSGHNGDFEAARAALKTKAKYIGIIGSRKKQAFVRARLLDAGFSEQTLTAPRIHAPVGIALGGGTPEEVALSIAAELVMVRAGNNIAYSAVQPPIIIKGAGDIASGIALRLRKAGFSIIMTEIAAPSAIRRAVSFSRAVTEGCAQIEDVYAELVKDAHSAKKIVQGGKIAVIVDESALSVAEIRPVILIDAIMAKRNCGTKIDDAPCVICAGPGFTAGENCHAVVETARGHTLGRVYYANSDVKTALANTGIPGEIGGFSAERIIRAPAGGIWTARAKIGDYVKSGDIVGEVAGGAVVEPARAKISGIVRGILPTGFEVRAGLKSGDIDPRCEPEHCRTVSDKALAIAGGVLEAILKLKGNSYAKK